MIGEILTKLAKGEKLNPSELFELSQWGNRTEESNMFVKSIQDGSGSLKVNNISAFTGDFAYPPSGDSVRLVRSTDTVIAHNTETGIDFEEVYYDDNSMWSPSNPSEVTIKRTGKYLVTLRCLWGAAAATGYRLIVCKHGSEGINSWDSPYNSNSTNFVSDEINLVKGTPLTVVVRQTSGGNATLEYVRMTVRLLRLNDDEVSV